MKICTTNPGKIAEFGGLLAPLDIALEPITNLKIEETKITFKDNAIEKAMGYAKHVSKSWILAEDSGLVVPALNNLPGPWSARFADLNLQTLQVETSGRNRTIIDPLNNERVLTLMKDVPKHKRGAYFVATIVVLSPEREIAFLVEERAYGYITDKPRGNNGFGYDPIFASDTSFGKTWAEIDNARKSLISHRNKAAFAFMSWICSTTETVW